MMILCDDLNAAMHISGVLEACSRSLYALRILCSHGLPTNSLHKSQEQPPPSPVHLLYASPAWWGFIPATHQSCLECFLQRTIRIGYLLPKSPTATAMIADAGDRLLASVASRPDLVLRQRCATFSLVPATCKAHMFIIIIINQGTSARRCPLPFSLFDAIFVSL